MQVAGVCELGGPVEVFDLPDPRPLAADEVLIAVKAAGIGNWDEIVRNGNWDVGAKTPMALGVEAAGTILAAGSDVRDFAVAEEVLCHPLQLRDQGTWAPQLIAAASSLAHKPESVTWECAAAFPVPALTAEQVLSGALALRAGETLLVHGAGGVTGGLIVQLAALRGAKVIATCSAASVERVRDLGAQEVFDYNEPTWPNRARHAAGVVGIPVGANAAPQGAVRAMTAVADGGRLATITSDPPDPERGIKVSNVYVRSDGEQLERLATLLGDGLLSLLVADSYHLAETGSALAKVIAGKIKGAVVAVL